MGLSQRTLTTMLLGLWLASAVAVPAGRAEDQRGSRTDRIRQAGVMAAVQAGTTMESVMRETLRQAELMVVLPPRTREQEVEAGLADVFMSDYPYTRRMLLSQHDWVRVIEPSPPLGITPYAYAVRCGDEGWLARVNAFADGRLLAAARRYDLVPVVTLD